MPLARRDVQSEQGYAADEQYGGNSNRADPVAEDFKVAEKETRLRPNRKKPIQSKLAARSRELA